MNTDPLTNPSSTTGPSFHSEIPSKIYAPNRISRTAQLRSICSYPFSWAREPLVPHTSLLIACFFYPQNRKDAAKSSKQLRNP